MIHIRDLTKRYDATEALRGISIHVRRGELFGFLGPNGAGKTTTLQILAGLLRPTSGSATVAGFDVATHPLEVKRRIGYVPDRPYVYERLTGRELLRLFGDLYDLDRAAAERDAARWLHTFGLTEHAHELIEGYSHGMKQRIVLAATLLHDPELLIVDEPMVGLDPHGARLFKDLMRERCAQSRTVLMSTHTLQVAEETCDRVGILHRGRILAVGTVAELRARVHDAPSGNGASAPDRPASLEDIFLTLTGTDEAVPG